MVGAVLEKGGRILGRGWHRRAGEAHAEIEALGDARKHERDTAGATLYVTLEPCSTHGRTPPCTDAIIEAGIDRVFIGAIDPNPSHGGKALPLLRRKGIAVSAGVLGQECERLNEAFNHWILHRTPLVTVKAAMTMDGKIASATGESKWITGGRSRAYGMELRLSADAILVGINTILADDPSLTFRGRQPGFHKRLRRIVLDSDARTPLSAKVVTDQDADLTTIVASESAPGTRVKALSERVRVLVAPLARNTSVRRALRTGIDLRWLLKQLGAEQVTHLLVEGGGEVNASFLLGDLAQRVAFFYAPKVLGGRDSRKAVAGEGARSLNEGLDLTEVRWRRLGTDWLLQARVTKKEH
jgi:diaminohydroxyphosphoribosylaminopyrimidine deaminase/5-amino-6-(5-phosphoribosylamino)uracil reductase